MGLFGGRKKDKEQQPAQGSADSTASVERSAEGQDDQPVTFDDKSVASARKWFQQAKKLVDDRNYDYAIESYLTGLKFWPEAVEEGHQPLRVAAYSRRETGGKKPGTMDVMKHSMSGRDAVQAMLNAEWLWARDPGNVSYMEGVVKNAAKARLEDTVLFIGPIYFDAAKNEKKISKERFLLLHKIYVEMGDRCERRGDLAKANSFFEGAVTVLHVLQQLSGASMKFTQELKDLAAKVTMIKGKYDSSEDFRGSIKDSGAQKDTHDRERMVLDDDRLEQLVDDARQQWQDNPGVGAKLLNLAELLCRDEQPDHEKEAIELLEAEYAKSKNYSYKSRADDIRMKQLRRRVRELGDGDKQALRQARVDQLRFELKVYKERTAQYATDNRLKFEYGKRLVTAGKFDDAIPILQEARNDPKNRLQCMSLIGRCFFEKGFHTQAIQTYESAIGEHDISDDDLSKELYYWMGRSCEASGKTEQAEKAYGQIIQWDYNFRDVRDRLSALANS